VFTVEASGDLLIHSPVWERAQELGGGNRYDFAPLFARGNRFTIWSTQALMPAVDRAILRIAVYELVYATDVPPAVAVNEAVEAAKSLSTDDSPRFVNGLLGQIMLISPELRGA